VCLNGKASPQSSKEANHFAQANNKAPHKEARNFSQANNKAPEHSKAIVEAQEALA
jgi:hypothetical protein